MTTSLAPFPARAACPLCGCERLKPVLEERPDYEYDTSVSLPYAACRNSACGLVFVTAMPPIDVIQGFYKKYSTHSEYRPLSLVARLIASIGARMRERRLMSLFDGTDSGSIKVLDYGCGSGDFLRQLKRLGIGQVAGYDFDLMACRHAQSLGLQAFETESEFQAAGPYDYIFLNHVIEHLGDPAASLSALARNLNPGGRLVIRTPNAGSFLARLFGSDWRGWETPRHLYLFNARSIRQLMAAANIPDSRIVKVDTSNAMFFGMFHESFHAAFWRNSAACRLLRHLACVATLPLAYLANGFRRDVGEEVCVVMEKDSLGLPG